MRVRVDLATMLLLGLGALGTICDAHNPERALWPGVAPNETEPLPAEKHTTKGHGCGFARNEPCEYVQDVSEPTVTGYLVKGSPWAMVVAPGGGYKYLAYGKEGTDVAVMLQGMGISAFVLKYRVPARKDRAGLPHWYAPLQDAQRAIRMVRSQGYEKVGFIGFSAGGHLSAHVSTAWKENSYQPVDKIDGLSARPDFTVFVYPWMLLPLNIPETWGSRTDLASEFEHSIARDHPPSLFIHAQDDHVAPNQGSLLYYMRLCKEGVKQSMLHIFDAGSHGFGLCQELTNARKISACQWPKQLELFLRTLKGDSEPVLAAEL